MKKLILLFSLFAVFLTNAQSLPITTVNNLKITNPVTGNVSTDKVILWNPTDKIARVVPVSDIAGGGASSVLYFDTIDDFPVTGDAAILYIDKDTGILYRWNVDEYITLSENVIQDIYNTLGVGNNAADKEIIFDNTASGTTHVKGDGVDYTAGGGTTSLKFRTPSNNSNVFVPRPTTSGDYTSVLSVNNRFTNGEEGNIRLGLGDVLNYADRSLNSGPFLGVTNIDLDCDWKSYIIALTNETMDGDITLTVKSPVAASYLNCAEGMEFIINNSSDYVVTFVPDTGVILNTDTLVIPKNATAHVRWIEFVFGTINVGQFYITYEFGSQSTGSTDLSYTPSPTAPTVDSSTGTSATLPLVDNTNAGLMSPAEHSKLAGLNGSLYELISNKATDLSSNDNTHYPTTAAVQTAITTAVTGLLDYRGGYDASTNLFPATGGSGIAGAVLKSDFWICSVSGTLGGTAVTPGDLIIASVDTPAQTSANWDLISNELGYTAENSANKSTSVTTDHASNTKYPSVKSVYDWATGIFQQTLVSGTTIKTLEGINLLGSGNVDLAKTDVGLANVDNTSDATKNAASVALTNKDLTSGTNTFPTLNQNTTGTAANLSGTPALPNGTTATTQSANDNSTKIGTTAYADAKVQNSMSASTTIAPSATAVLTTLAGYIKPIYRSGTAGTPVTGTTAETQVLQLSIPANTLTTSDWLTIGRLNFNKTTNVSTVTVRIKISTSATMPSGTTGRIATYTTSSSIQGVGMIRKFWQTGGNLKGIDGSISYQNDAATATSGASASQTFDPTVQNYLYVSVQCSSASESIFLESYEITN